MPFLRTSVHKNAKMKKKKNNNEKETKQKGFPLETEELD